MAFEVTIKLNTTSGVKNLLCGKGNINVDTVTRRNIRRIQWAGK
jgi:hypothetical protein